MRANAWRSCSVCLSTRDCREPAPAREEEVEVDGREVVTGRSVTPARMMRIILSSCSAGNGEKKVMGENEELNI